MTEWCIVASVTWVSRSFPGVSLGLSARGLGSPAQTHPPPPAPPPRLDLMAAWASSHHGGWSL